MPDDRPIAQTTDEVLVYVGDEPARKVLRFGEVLVEGPLSDLLNPEREAADRLVFRSARVAAQSASLLKGMAVLVVRRADLAADEITVRSMTLFIDGHEVACAPRS